MLQPKSYTQIARPNLYNVAYRRVGMYKGMGKLHPTNYLQIGYRPNMIGATTGQYNTFSGQLSLLPPSLRGLGQVSFEELANLPTQSDPSSWMVSLQPGALAAYNYAMAVPPPTAKTPSPTLAQVFQSQPKWLPWAIGGGFLAVLLLAKRR